MDEKPQVPNYVQFISAGIAGMGATCFVQPFHLIKNRIQSSPYQNDFSTLHITREIIKNEGMRGFYCGLSAGIMRQATYTTTRLGVYAWLSNHLANDSVPPGLMEKVALGMIAGACGAFVGTPTEIALIRMTLDGTRPDSQKWKYKSVLHSLIEISRKDGFTYLWKGVTPTVTRSMVVNGSQLASYSQAKQTFLQTGYLSDNILCQLICSMISGLFTVIASLPLDMVKTRIQNMKNNDNGKQENCGMAEVFRRIIQTEGTPALWRGFIAYYAKLGPHTVLTFLFLERLETAYRTYVLDN